MTTVFNLAVIWCWIIFILYWIGGARGVKPVAERQSRLSSMAYRGPLTLGGMLLWWPRTPAMKRRDSIMPDLLGNANVSLKGR